MVAFGVLTAGACALLASCASPYAPCDTFVGPEPNTTNAPAPSIQSTAPATTNALEFAVEDAVLFGLEHNQALKLDRLNPELQQTFEAQQRAVFDPTLAAGLSWQDVNGQSLTSAGTQTTDVKTTVGNVSINEYLPTGTRLSIGANANGQDMSSVTDTLDAVRGGISITQSLLQGGSVAANLASLRQARLDTLSSEYELRGFSESLVADIEQTYWDYQLAQRRILIFEDSLKLAEQQLDETRERIKVGKLAEVELAAAKAELASREEGLIDARGDFETTRLHLLQLLNPPGTNPWDCSPILTTPPKAPDAPLDNVASHVELALRMRPEMNQARLSIQRGELEVVKTKNGLLPQMDLFINLGKTGYSDSFGKPYR